MLVARAQSATTSPLHRRCLPLLRTEFTILNQLRDLQHPSPLSGMNTTPDLLLVNKRTPLSERNTTPDQGGGGDEDAAKRKLSNPILARVVVGRKLSKPRQKPVSERPILRMRGDREARYRSQSTGHYQTDLLASRKEKFNDISPQAGFEEDLYAAMALSGTKAQVLEMHKDRLEAKEESPPFNKPREATPDLTTFTNIQKRECRMTQWDIKSAGYENITAGWRRNSLQSHWFAYPVQWLTLEAHPPRDRMIANSSVMDKSISPSPKSYRSDDFENTYSPGSVLDKSISPSPKSYRSDDFENTYSPGRWNQFTDPNNTTVFIGGLSG
ncbi:uncharacterized protein J4E78_006800 [Alternaria triticimaculans]|uniref:uncharacterized protein n=1 Tax=Alternaria triticimaculans TaxID=297637 RepID=UPI0020C389E4|nr:uncharacterized protein J4E78_006800 [Alternaria triticimaculans]KAI4656909.1 hypothetical protein J4E78_006800 [Alternaria triticimaculans]